MREIKIGDCVWIRGLVHSDCFGLKGKVLDVCQSALFGPGVKRCRVDFNGKIRRLLNVHLVHVSRRDGTTPTAA